MEDSPRGGAMHLAVAAFMVGIAIMMNIFACTLVDGHNLYPLLVLFIQLMAPMPVGLCGFSSEGAEDGGPNVMAVVGWFLTGAFASMALFIPIAMVHEGSVSGGQLGLTLGSQALTYIVLGFYMKMKRGSGYDSF